jgi:hypothetical protein
VVAGVVVVVVVAAVAVVVESCCSYLSLSFSPLYYSSASRE